VRREPGCQDRNRDILLVHTGFLDVFYEVGREEFYEDFNEPGITYSLELVQWFQDMEIPNLVTDAISNETTFEPNSGVVLALHCALMRNLGLVLTEIIDLNGLAEDCVADNQWTFLYVAAPLKVVQATGSPGEIGRNQVKVIKLQLFESIEKLNCGVQLGGWCASGAR
jgi:kynurenine formamidase